MSLMRLAPLVRLIPPEPARPARRRGWVLGVSLLLHVLLLALLLLVSKQPRPDGDAAASYELRFEGADSGTATPGSAPQETPRETPDAAQTPPAPPPPAQPPPAPSSPMEVLPGPVAPPALVPPAPDTPAPVPPAPDAPAMPDVPQPTDEAGDKPGATVAPPAASPSPAPPAAAPPTEAPPSTAPAPQAVVTPEPDVAPPPASASRPEIRVELPRPPMPDLVLPVPPVPQRAPQPVPRPLARAAPPRPRPAAPPPPATGTFANPMDLNFGSAPTRMAAPRMTAPRGSVASRSLDLSPGSSRSAPSRTDVFFDARAAKLGADWEEGLKAYWLRHRYYPRQAAEDGEDGTVELELTVDGSGRVRTAAVKSRSGSTWIDMAAVGTWRNAQLPPLPPELTAPYTFSITINYILLR